ncbi:hypothetical protein C8R47DRAFT_1313367 [Mycena vitilis]|nr:hypothetical protein C8R47DRAFT_1313367 [Mycena vitilis]
MTTMGGTPFSFVAPALFKDIPIIPLAVITTVVIIPVLIHYASPARLTDILGDAMAKAKAAHDEALEAGQISRSQKREFKTLRREVSAIKVETLRNSRSYWKLLWGFAKGRTVTVRLCIWKVRQFETDLKIQKENRAG